MAERGAIRRVATLPRTSISQGAHPKAISKRMGHKSTSFTMNVYGHLFPEDDLALTNSLDAAFRAAACAGLSADDEHEMGEIIPFPGWQGAR